ncbi:DUF456 domain-containing protein [Natroniella sulfidigena]|uniref:DUF456 domain-containing protein n=1 Tax=Natroniella sulfidigena TaxID=723921 RepID=UPI00200AFFB2|nr:DUF456 domain-containing protein [Natroniella sulfidigena]MCK8817881.1 DUF456 domain-containing protein [Natroniella sulfidigena]
MNLFLVSLTAILFITSLIGVVVPLIPDTILLWVAFFLSRFFEPPISIPTSFWIAMLLITLLNLSSDFIMNSFFIKKQGGSKWTILAGSIGLIGGSLLLGPIGIIVGPFVMVFTVTFFVEQTGVISAFKRALGTIMAFFSSSIIKIGLQLTMISWYLYLIFR